MRDDVLAERKGAMALIQAQNKSYVPRILEYYEKNVFCPPEARKPFPLFVSSIPPSSTLSTSSTSSTSSSSPSPSPSPSSSSSPSSTALLHDRLGTSAVELSRGCRGGRGPGLVLIRGVTASPEEFIEWVRWRSPLPRAVARIYWLGASEDDDDGDEEKQWEETEREREREKKNEGDRGGALATFAAQTSAELAHGILSGFSPSPPPPETPVRVMAVPKSLQLFLVDALAEAGWPLDVRVRAGGTGAVGTGANGGGVGGGGGLFVVAAALDGLDERVERGPHDPPLPTPRYRAALVRASAVLSDTTEQREVGKRTCRAEWKLSEALAGLLEEELGEGGEGGEGGGERGKEGRRAAAAAAKAIRAVDVGASPGGWTRHLALCVRASRVVALDPATLDGDVEALPNVSHLRMLSHSPGALEAVRGALLCHCRRAGEGAGAGAGEEGGEETEEKDRRDSPATLLTCDANQPPTEAAKCILPLVPLLAPGALVVLTLKLRYPGKEKDFATRAAMEVLGPAGLELVDSRWLMANTMYERTLVLRRKKEGD